MTDETIGARDAEAVRRSVERMARMFSEWGFPPMAARVLFTMMASDEDALTAAELGERIGVSPAAISGAVRYLVHINLLYREPVPGSRRDRYRMPDDAWYEASMTKLTLFSQVADAAKEAVEAVGGPDTPAGAHLSRMRDYVGFLQMEVPGLLDKWRQQKPETFTK
ncbi:MarR family protein [Sinosporangium album]|uniref:MarR family protein n=1 Tax=Sinosporangium album TaxID=504805 RepID=A0A1G8DN06_9ACTN|nr:MarR family transcriptional regulator [Sinosporangium album]SDH58951.1 MarR family protein [Sinosporangium album]